MTAADRRWSFRRLPGAGAIAVRRWAKCSSADRREVLDAICQETYSTEGKREARDAAIALLKAASEHTET